MPFAAAWARRIVFVCALLVPLPVGASPPTVAQPAGRLRAEGGFLDLAGCDFGAKTTYKLDGEWLFVPGRLLSASDDWSGALRQTVPATWNLGERGTGGGARGVGSYRLTVNLGAPRQGLGIRYTTVATAFELEVNGVLVGGAGRVGTEAQNAEAAYRPGVVRVDAPAGLLDIVIRVSNHEYRAGGLWRSFTIGDAGALFAAKRARDRRSLAFFAAAIVFALNALAIHAFRPRERSFCTSVCFPSSSRSAASLRASIFLSSSSRARVLNFSYASNM